jgi:hypothetical protein
MGLSNKSRPVLRSYDLGDPYNIFALRPQLQVDWLFRHGSTLEADVIEETDMLFVDTLHTYGQVKGELERHGNQARKYIVIPRHGQFRPCRRRLPQARDQSRDPRIHARQPALGAFRALRKQ